jgi:CreA protein
MAMCYRVKNRTSITMTKPALFALAAICALSACSPAGDKVGDFTTDLTGNEFNVTAVRDPGIPNVVCHFATFERGFIDRVGNGKFFEDPSNSSVDCQASGPIDVVALARLPKNTEIASQGTSLLFKRIALRRIIDVPNRSIIYLSYGREIKGASAKIDMSTVSFGEAPVVAPSAPARP